MSNKNFGISGKGYYIALILCAAAIGISGYLYYRNNDQAQQVSVQEPVIEDVAAITLPPTTAPAAPAATKPSAAPSGGASQPASAPTEPSQAAPTEAPAKRTLQTAAPLDGDAISEFAAECLSYNETTRDWRVHYGIDLAAPEGTPVMAAADGTVAAVYEDEALGHTVVIRHSGGYTTRYSNLADSPCVSVGQSVTLGQTIGTAGCSALTETALGSHLHFAVTYQDVPMDPEEFLSMD